MLLRVTYSNACIYRYCKQYMEIICWLFKIKLVTVIGKIVPMGGNHGASQWISWCLCASSLDFICLIGPGGTSELSGPRPFVFREHSVKDSGLHYRRMLDLKLPDIL